MPPLACPARIMPVTRIELMPELLAIPKHVAPPPDASILDHALFALKHETLQLAILHEAMKLVQALDLETAIAGLPNSAYLRRAAFVWEKANGVELALPPLGGNYVDMFDAKGYYTGQNWERSARLRVNFNGLGPYAYCPVVLRDEALEAQGASILDQLKVWATDPANADVLDRALGWAYLSETRDSYAIENETASPDRERAFVDAMQHLQDRAPLTEDHLAKLQQTVISRPASAEFEFRGRQNWLQRGGHGALAVRYVPPPPGPMLEMMEAFMAMANAKDDAPPLVKAGLVSFGFVFLHPFIDGNGRISRLLAHHSLNFNGALPDVKGTPAILPLSVAMKQDEKGYLETLESFSKPARDLWDVQYIGEGDFRFTFRSSPMVYAHWAGQNVARFITACAKTALEQTLIDEAAYLHAYDQAYRKIDSTFDIPDKVINLLIQWIHQNGCKMPNGRRKSQELYMLEAQEIDAIEKIVVEFFQTPVQGPKAGWKRGMQ